jgi:tetratricopeptide (TPR) repeat protein
MRGAANHTAPRLAIPPPEVRRSSVMGARPLSTRAAAALVAFAALAVHGRTLAFGFIGLDDRDLIVGDQAFLSRPANLLRVFGRSYLHVVDPAHAYWRPLVTASYVLDAQWSGARPLGYHATNLLLHAVASVLVLSLLRRFALGRRVALAGALVFAVHPALASAVAWIPGRNDSLLAVTALASWLLLRKTMTPWRWAAHFAFFALALMAKETALVLPLVWVAELGCARAGTLARRWGVAFAWASLVALRFALHPGVPHASLSEVVANLPLLATALGKILLPLRPRVLATAADLSVLPGLVAGALVALAAWLLPRARRRVLAFGTLAFVLFLAPSLAVPGTLVLDHRLVLPAVGVLLVAGECVRAAAPEARALAAFGGVIVGALALVTLAFEGAFHDPAAFAREAVAGSPRSPLAHFCRGQVAQRAGDDDRALVEYREALALGPAEVVHNDIAVIAMKRGRWPEAEQELRAELELNPGYTTAQYNLAIVLRHEGRTAEACEAAENALRGSLEDDEGGAKRERERDCAP